MIIRSIYINDFSGTKDRRVEFASGFNVVEGPNESGKTTVASFIKFIFYGLADKAERTRYFSWGSSSASGSMVVEVDGRQYRIERECGDSGRSRAAIIDLATGAPCFEGASPADVFLGVPAELFSHTAFIGQAAGGSVDGEKVSRAIENILFTGDESTSAAKAEKKLDDARVLLYHKSHKGGRIYDLLCDRDVLCRRLETAKQSNGDLIARENSVRDTRRLIEENRVNLENATAGLERVNNASRSRSLAKLNDLRTSADDARGKYESICERDVANGYLPDAEYAASVERVERDLKQVEEELEKTNEEYETYKQKDTDVSGIGEFSEKLRSMGGADEITDNIFNLHARRRRAHGFAVAAFILAALLAAVGAVAYFVRLPAPLDFFKGELMYAAMFGLAALIFLAVGVTAVISASRARMEVSEIICDLDIDNEAELERRINNLNFDETRLRLHNARIDEFETRLKKICERKAALDSVCGELLERWGKTDISGVAEAAAESVRSRAELKAEAEKYELACETLASQLGLDDPAEELERVGTPEQYDELTPEREDRLRYEYDFYNRQSKALTDKLYAAEKELAVLEATVESPSELADRIRVIDEEIDKLSKKHRALIMAFDTLQGAANDLRESISPRLAKTAGELMSSLSDGKYERLGVGQSLQLAYDANEQSHAVEYMSAGTGDIAYLSLRFALIELLFNGVTPPLIFDESFSRLDDGRYINVLNLIAEMSRRGMQTILFTSQTRDASLADKYVPDCNKIDF